MSNDPCAAPLGRRTTSLLKYCFLCRMEALNQSGQHALHLVSLPRQSAKIFVRQEIEIMSKKYVILRFARGPHGLSAKNDKSP